MEKVLNECKNCGESVNGNYCSNCGQFTDTGKINAHYLLHEFQHSVLHVDRGIFYTAGELLIRPGNTIRQYLAGKRVKHFKPFSFLLILSAVYGFIAHFLDMYPEMGLIQDIDPHNAEITGKMMEWFYSHYSMMILVSTPLASSASYWVFRKKGYNYFEHLVINAYIAGIQILALSIANLFYYVFPYIEIIFVVTVLSYVYNVWVFVQLFKRKSWLATSFLAALSIVIYFVLATLIISFLMAAMLVLSGGSNLSQG